MTLPLSGASNRLSVTSRQRKRRITSHDKDTAGKDSTFTQERRASAQHSAATILPDMAGGSRDPRAPLLYSYCDDLLQARASAKLQSGNHPSVITVPSETAASHRVYLDAIQWIVYRTLPRSRGSKSHRDGGGWRLNSRVKVKAWRKEDCRFGSWGARPSQSHMPLYQESIVNCALRRSKAGLSHRRSLSLSSTVWRSSLEGSLMSLGPV